MGKGFRRKIVWGFDQKFWKVDRVVRMERKVGKRWVGFLPLED